MYNPMQLLKQEPSAIKVVFTAILGALIIRGTISISAEELAAWGVAVEGALGLLYVRQAVVSKDGLRQLGEALDGHQPGRQRPLRAPGHDAGQTWVAVVAVLALAIACALFFGWITPLK